MLSIHQISLFFVVAMMAVTAYFLFGSIPLLILKHDNTMDATFIKSFYTTYFRISIVVALLAALSHLVASRTALSAVAATIAALTLVLRHRFIPQMESWGAEIRGNNITAIPSFRRTHKTAIGLNTAQLLVLLGSLSLL